MKFHFSPSTHPFGQNGRTLSLATRGQHRIEGLSRVLTNCGKGLSQDHRSTPA